MYSKKDGSNNEKMFSCVCRANKGKSTTEKWNDILGFEGHSSTDITTVTDRDEVAEQILKFIEASNNQISKFMPIKIELNEYDLKLEYVITYTKKHEEYAISVVVHDKKDHSNALITMDFLTKKEYKEFVQANV